MTRKQFLGLLGLIGCTDYMQLAQQGILGNVRNDYFALGVIGDSNANGAATTITSCASNTLYNFNGTTFDMITTQSVSNGNPTLGSIWQPFATAYKSAFGRPVALMNGGKGGSYYHGDATANSWGSAGNLRGDFETKVTDGLAAINKASLDLIIVNLGINDVRNGFTIASIRTDMELFYDWLDAEFPGVPVLVVQVGRTESSINTTLLYEVRENTIIAVRDHSNMNLCGSGIVWHFLSGYEADNLHFNATGQAGLADNFVKWLQNSAYSKWGRSVISTLFDVPTDTRKGLLDDFIESQVTSGNYFLLEGLWIFQTGTANNTNLDLSFIGYGAPSGPTFVANDCYSFNGTDDYFATGLQQNITIGARATQNDLILGAHIETNSSSGTVALFGATSTPSLSLVQNGVRYRCNDATLSAGTETTFANSSVYSIRRSGTTKSLYKNKTSNASTTQASTGVINLTMVVGAIQSTGPVISSFIQAEIRMFYFAKNTAFDLDNFYDNWNTLTTSW